MSDVNTGGDIEVEPINTGSGSEEGTPVNDNSHNEIYSNKVFQEIVVGFKSVPKFYELDDKRLSQEQKELLNIIKAHLSDFSSDKKGRFKISTPWPTFKDEILGLK